MNNNTGTIYALLLAVAAISFAACASESKQPESQEVPGGITGLLANNYSSVDEIARDAHAIAIVEMQSVSYQEYANQPFSVGQAVVKELLKDESGEQLSLGSTITVGEMGGRIRREVKEKPGELGDEFVIGVGGVLPIVAGRTYLMFLDVPSRIGPVEGGAYVPLGAFQGKIELTESGKLDLEGADEVLTGPEYGVPRELNGRQWTEVRAEIQATIS